METSTAKLYEVVRNMPHITDEQANEVALVITNTIEHATEVTIAKHTAPLQQSIDQVQRNVDQVQKNVDRVEKSVEQVQRNVDRVEKSVDQVQKNVDRVEKSVEQVQKNVDRVEKNVEQVQRNVDRVQKNLDDHRKETKDDFAEVRKDLAKNEKSITNLEMMVEKSTMQHSRDIAVGFNKLAWFIVGSSAMIIAAVGLLLRFSVSV